MGDPTGGASLERYTALVAALLGVRTDNASARFDAEVEAALAANRLDVATARTLRWWQRASVRAVESYAASVVPAALATGSDADQVAALESDESAASWQRAQAIKGVPPSSVPLPARVITIPDPATRRRSAKEIQQAVREALRATAAPVTHGRDRGDHVHSAPTA
jgi:hypothetical protein